MPNVTAVSPPLTRSTSEQVGANVAAELRRGRVTQGAAAAELGLSRTSLTKRIAGQPEFTPTELRTLALMLGIDLRRFLDGVDTADVA